MENQSLRKTYFISCIVLGRGMPPFPKDQVNDQ